MMKRIGCLIVLSMAVALIAGCFQFGDESRESCCGTCQTTGVGIEKSVYGKLDDGTQVDMYTLTNAKGAIAKILSYGGIVTELHMPDRDGRLGDVVLGFEKLEDYVAQSPYFGCLVGRYGNRIAKGRFKISNNEYTLAANNTPDNKPCHLHGGNKGFDKHVWAVNELPDNPEGPALELTRVSPDMEEGYPGNLTVKAVYTLTHNNELKLTYEASTDKTTVINLTHHSYWNLNEATDTILDHELMIKADAYTPVDSGLIPTGELRPVKGTPFDFNTPTRIGVRVNDDNEQLKYGAGYDHNWVMSKQDGKVNVQGSLYEAGSGRLMEVLSDEPGLQFYCGNFLDGTLTGKKGIVYKHRYGLCLEPQHYPDSPNQPDFPSVLLKPGEIYNLTIVYRFSIR